MKKGRRKWRPHLLILAYEAERRVNSQLRAVDVLSLEPFGTPFYLELHLGALLQGPVAGHLDRREVNKNILAAGPLDKSIALGGVKPFDDTLFSHYLISPLSLPAVPGPCLKTLPLSHVIRSIAIGYLKRQGPIAGQPLTLTFRQETDDKRMMLNALRKIRLAGWMLLASAALTGCGGGGFDARSTLESRPVRLDGEQVILDQNQLDCGVREDLWVISPMGDTRSIGRLTQKGRDLQFSDDVQIGDQEIKTPYAQIRGSFPIAVLQVGAVRDEDAFTKSAEAKVAVRIDHSCFQNPLPVVMGVRHGKFDPTSNPVFRLKLEGQAWLTDQVVH